MADDGPGMDAARIATLFAVDRPLTSTKLLRRPTRGAVGNGLRVVTGAAIASGGALWVESRGRRFEIKVHLGTGRTEAVEVACNAPTNIGTKVTIRFGTALARSARRRSGPAGPALPRSSLRADADPPRLVRRRSWLELGRRRPRARRSPSCSPTWGSRATTSGPPSMWPSPSWRSSSCRRSPSSSRAVRAGSRPDYAKAEDAGALVEVWAKAKARCPRARAPARWPSSSTGRRYWWTLGSVAQAALFINAGGFYCLLRKCRRPLAIMSSCRSPRPWCRSSTTAKPRTCRTSARIVNAVSAAMRAAEKRLEKPTAQEGRDQGSGVGGDGRGLPEGQR